MTEHRDESLLLEKIIIADHRGFCMGVKRAINIAEDTRNSGVEDVTILKEIVHNNSVVNRFREAGVQQQFSVDDVNSGTLVISAHGVAPDIINKAKEKNLNVIDATCPLVTRIHDIVDKLMDRDFHVIHFGDEHHDETMGVVGHARPGKITVVGTVEELKALPDDMPKKLAMTSQATSEVQAFLDAEKIALQRWPEIKIFNTVCNATTQRQSSIVKLADQVDMILVVGSTTSANSQRLTSIGEALCGEAHLIDSDADIKEEWIHSTPERQIRRIGISAGASTPDFLVEGAIARIEEIAGNSAEVIRPKGRKSDNELAYLREPVA